MRRKSKLREALARISPAVRGNRRQSRRFHAEQMALLHRSEAGDGSTSKELGQTRDISAGGAMIATRRSCRPGEEIRLSLDLGSDLLETRGRVLDCRPDAPLGYRVRLRFLDLGTRERSTLAAFLRDQECAELGCLV